MRIKIVHTGGTIGMAPTKDGFAPQTGVVEDAIATLLKGGAIPVVPDFRTLDPLIDSAQSTPPDWDRIAEAIVEEYQEFDAFVVIHGTDTLAYTASALCLALRGLQKPVIITGSMLPLKVDKSDGWQNLRDALVAAIHAPAGVWVQFAGHLLHAGRVRKTHSAAMDAFAAVPSVSEPRIMAPELEHHRLQTHAVGVFSTTPGCSAEILEFAALRCDGLVVRCYGSGTSPDTPGLRNALGIAVERKVPVIAVSQCAEGGIKLGTYAAGKILRDNEVIDGRDTTPEMAYVKMHYALSHSSDLDKRRTYLHHAHCGEFTQDQDDV